MIRQLKQLLAILFYGISLLFIASCASNLEMKSENKNAKLIYQFKDIQSSGIEFVPGSQKLVINHATDVILVDYNKNKIINTFPTPNPDDLIQAIKVSDKNNRLLISTPTSSQVWDIKQMQLINSYQAQKNSRVNGLSPDGRLLIFDNHIYDIDTKKSLLEISYDAVPFTYAFSKDMQYLIIDGHVSGSSIIDLNSKTQMDSIIEKGMYQIRFKQNNDFYIGYHAELSTEQGGYYSSSIGLYNLSTLKRISEYSPANKISCWTKLNDDKLLTAQTDGTLELLSSDLTKEKTWKLNEKFKLCITGQQHKVWLASEKSGIYSLDTLSGNITRVINTSHSPAQMIVSENDKYLGILKSVQDGSEISVYLLN